MLPVIILLVLIVVLCLWCFIMSMLTMFGDKIPGLYDKMYIIYGVITSLWCIVMIISFAIAAFWYSRSAAARAMTS